MPKSPARHKPGEQCPRCGTVHLTAKGGPACVGHSRTNPDQACRKPPKDGLTVCWHHGAASKSAQEAGQRRHAEQQLADAARKLIPDIGERAAITNPLETLLELASEANAFRESLRELVNKLDGQIRYVGTGGTGEQLRAEVSTYRQAFKDTTDVLIAIAKLDIEKMLARIEARKVEFVLDSLSHGCDDAGLNDEQKRMVMAGVGRHLRSVRRPAA